jgi:hypothetical protein
MSVAQQQCHQMPESSIKRSPGLTWGSIFEDVDSDRRRLLVEILEWNCYTQRPLKPCELLVALSTRTELDRQVLTAHGPDGLPKLSTEEELLNFCGGVLQLTETGHLDFVDQTIRHFLKSSGARVLGVRSCGVVHERIAAVCFRHNACLSQELLFRPWTSIGRVLRGETKRCGFQEYAVLNWHQHFRKADPSSRYLPYLLNCSIETILKHDSGATSKHTEMDQKQHKLNGGLWICSIANSKKLGSVYLDMGASLSAECLGVGVTMLHVAAANQSSDVVQLLLDRGADVEGRVPKEGIMTRCTSRTPLHISAARGHLRVVRTLVQARADINAETLTMHKTPLQLAVEFGHTEVVRYLLDCDASTTAGNFEDGDLAQVALTCGHEHVAALVSQQNRLQEGSACGLTLHKRKFEDAVGPEGTCTRMRPLPLRESSSSSNKGHNSRKSVTYVQTMRRQPSRRNEADSRSASELDGWHVVGPVDLRKPQ